MKNGRLARAARACSIAALLLSSSVGAAGAQTHDDHMTTSGSQQKPNPQQSALVKAVRDATERFRDVSQAEKEELWPAIRLRQRRRLRCDGTHYVNFPLVGDGEIDAAHPEIILYEPRPNGRMRITGADFLVSRPTGMRSIKVQPELMGQLFHFFESPNRFGLPPFYTLHVWAWKDNPNGTFTNWNPTCRATRSILRSLRSRAAPSLAVRRRPRGFHYGLLLLMKDVSGGSLRLPSR